MAVKSKINYLAKRALNFVLPLVFIATTQNALANVAWYEKNRNEPKLGLIDVVNASPMTQNVDALPESSSPSGFVLPQDYAAKLTGYQGDLRSTWRGTTNLTQRVLLEGLKPQTNNRSDQPAIEYEYLFDDTPFNTSRVNTYGNRVTTNFPYRAIGRLGFLRNGSTYQCTATLIGPSLLITAAHCVAEYGGDFYKAFVFTPAYDAGEAPFGVWQIVSGVVNPSFIDGSAFCQNSAGAGCSNDVALLMLETKTDHTGKEYRLGEKIGWLGLGYNGYGVNFNGTDYVALTSQFGYPGSHDDGETMQRTDAQARYSPESDMAESATRQTQGSSGGPWIVNFGQHAELSGGISLGSDAASNSVIAVTSAGNGTGRVLASWFNDGNFTPLYDELCAQNTANCEYSPTNAENPAIRVNLEEPVNGKTYSGIGNLRGWALYDFGIDYLEVYIDGNFAFLAPYGGARSDVGNVFPNVADSANSGFGLAFGYGDLSAGEHEIAVVAVAKTGEYAISRSRFFVDRYHKSFIQPNDAVSVDSASFVGEGDRVELRDVMVDGRAYNLTLEWQTATQSFSTIAIENAE